MLDMNDIGYYVYMEEEDRRQALQRIADRAIMYVDEDGEIPQYIILSIAEDEGIGRDSLTQKEFHTILRLMSEKNLYF